MSCNNSTIYEQWKNKKLTQLKKSNAFKNKFIKLWEEYGTFREIDGERYFNEYKIDGSGDGAVKMSELLGQPDLHNEVDDHHLDYVKLFLNFNKLIKIEEGTVEAFKPEYVEQMKKESFDALYYEITESVVVESYFLKNIYDEENKSIGKERIEENEFLDELAWEIAERRRMSYYQSILYRVQFPKTYDEETGLTSRIEKIDFNEEVTVEQIEELMSSLYDGYWQDDVASGTREIVHFIPSLWDKVADYGVKEQIGVEILDTLKIVPIFVDGGYMISLKAAKRMNGVAFMKMLSEILDFHTKTKAKYKYRKALLALATFTIAALLIATGNVYAGMSMLLSFAANVTGNETLKIASYIVAIYAIATNPESLLNMTYTEAAELVVNVAGLYYSMRAELMTTEKQEVEDTDTATYMLYTMPYNAYDDIYCYDKLISVDSES